MRKIKRLDNIRSLGRLFCAIFALTAFYTVSEFILQNFTSSGKTLNNFEYYASLSFSEEELETAMKAREDLASLGETVTGIPGTFAYRYKTARTGSFNFNSLGFRGEEPKKKEKDEFRIAVYGDSRIVGIYLAEKDTVPGYVEKRLRETFKDKKITVMNLGIEGYSLPRAISFAELTAERLEVDLAVFYSGINDINYSFESGNIDLKPFTENEKVYQTLIDNIEGTKKKSFWKRSWLISVIKEAALSDSVKFFSSMKKEDIFQPLIPAYEQRAEEFSQLYLEKAHKASDEFKAKGIKTMFFFPSLLQLKEPLSKIERNMLYKNEMTFRGHNNYFIKCGEGIKGSKDPLLFSQIRLFKGHSETMFYDGIHFTPEASRIVAEDMAEKIIGFIQKENLLSE